MHLVSSTRRLGRTCFGHVTCSISYLSPSRRFKGKRATTIRLTSAVGKPKAATNTGSTHLDLLELFRREGRDSSRHVSVVRRPGRSHKLEAAEARGSLHEPHRPEDVVRLERLNFSVFIEREERKFRADVDAQMLRTSFRHAKQKGKQALCILIR